MTAYLRNNFRKIGAALALAALWLQIIAMPLSCLNMAQRSLLLSDAQLISICSVSGNHTLLVGADGQPIPASHGMIEHCPFCVVAGMALLAIIVGLMLFLRPERGRLGRLPATSSPTHDDVAHWPWILGPPSEQVRA